MIHAANVLIYAGIAVLVGLFAGPWWGGFVAAVAAVAIGLTLVVGSRRQ